MKALSKQQIEYAFHRVDQTVAAKVAKKLGPQPKAEPVSFAKKDKLDAIFSGDKARAVMKARGDDTYGYITEHFRYPQLEKQQEAAQKPVKEWSAKHAAALKAETKKAQKIKDQIMLSGEAAAALALLDKYAAEE